MRVTVQCMGEDVLPGSPAPLYLVSLALSSLLVLRTQVGEVVYHWNNDKTCTLHITDPPVSQPPS